MQRLTKGAIATTGERNSFWTLGLTLGGFGCFFLVVVFGTTVPKVLQDYFFSQQQMDGFLLVSWFVYLATSFPIKYSKKYVHLIRRFIRKNMYKWDSLYLKNITKFQNRNLVASERIFLMLAWQSCLVIDLWLNFILWRLGFDFSYQQLNQAQINLRTEKHIYFIIRCIIIINHYF